MLINVVVFLLFIAFGVMLSFGKGAFLISGYNMLSKEEKQKYDEKALCKFMGKFIFLIAFSISLLILSDILAINILYTIGLGITIVATIFLIIYVNTGNRFRKTTSN